MMDLHRLLVLTHVAAMIGLFSALAIEGVSLRFLRRATTYEQAREWTAVWTLLPAIGAPSGLLSLASGIYLATRLGLWDFSWTRVAVPVFVIVAVAGGVVGPRRSRVQESLGANTGPLPDALLHQIRQRSLTTSWRFRASLLAALVVDMIVKPERAIWLMVAFAVAGVVWSVSQLLP